MRIINLKRAIIILLMIGILTVVSGCARWPGEPEPEPGETEYQLKITVEVAGEIKSDDGIYYIVLDANESSVDEPGDNVEDWEDDFYYVKFDNIGFYFAQVEEGSTLISLTDSSYSEDKLQVTIALKDLMEDPNSIDINVVTTDSDNNTYDYLDPYFTINTDFGSSKNITDIEGDSGDGGADFDIVKVTAVITTLY